MALTKHAGDAFPSRTVRDAHGAPFALSSLRGKPTVVYFYPKDDTPGCTIEAKEFSAMKAAYDRQGIQIVGISKDSAASHEKFCAKYDLSIPLLVDEGGELIQELGIQNPLSRSAKRTTFLLDAEGNIVRVWESVKPAGHAAAVLKEAETSTIITE